MRFPATVQVEIKDFLNGRVLTSPECRIGADRALRRKCLGVAYADMLSEDFSPGVRIFLERARRGHLGTRDGLGIGCLA